MEIDIMNFLVKSEKFDLYLHTFTQPGSDSLHCNISAVYFSIGYLQHHDTLQANNKYEALNKSELPIRFIIFLRFKGDMV